jgi:hypothetical protein
MAPVSFSDPVFLKLHHAGSFRARTPGEGFEYLEQHWSGPRTAHYRQAKVLCRAAVDGIVNAETARVALIDAAEREGLLADAREVDGLVANASPLPVDLSFVSPHVDLDQDEVTDADLASYFRARDVLDDPSLSPSRKRALLAFWASDIHAVAGAPGFRAVRGVTVSIDSLLDALCELDAKIDQAAMLQGAATSVRSW